MGLRFRRSFKVAPGVRINVGKKSVGMSAGVRGARISTNTRTGSRATVGIPGTGLSYSQKLGGKSRAGTATSPALEVGGSPTQNFTVHKAIGSPSTDIPVLPTAATGYCNKCGNENQRAKIACDMCGSRLPWADAPQRPATARNIGNEFFPVQVSANIVAWPCVCGCCGDLLEPPPGAGQTGQNAYVVKMSMTSWQAMYCETCATHIELAQESQLPLPQGGVIVGCGCAPFAWLFFMIALGSNIVAIIIATFIAGIIVYASYANEQKERVKIQAKNELAMKQVTAAMQDRCAHYRPAVWLNASHGAIRQFAFRNEHVARLFAMLNEKKIVS